MNLFNVADVYIDRIVNSTSKARQGAINVNEQSRIKVLLLDKETVSTISMCATQSELLDHEIFLIDTIENASRDVMRHLKCLVYVKPCEESIRCLVQELQNPKYGEYHIFFNNMVSKSQLERLAEADNLEVVVKIEEIFQDYQILDQDLFSFDLESGTLFKEDLSIWNASGLNTCVNSLLSVLLSLKVRPDIRFDKNSKLCNKLARELNNDIEKHDKALFDFPTMDAPPMLIILDRQNDPMTPLLQPWTYRSMINEYIGIKRNIVDLSGIPDIDKDLIKVTLSSKQDPFFHDTVYLNFGELGDKVKQYVNNYKKATKSNSKIDTIEDIKNFIEKYPEFRKLSGNVAKHMAIVSELDRQLKLRDIWEISEVEQNLSVHKDNQEDYDNLIKILETPQVKFFYKIKLACIFLLRHSENNVKINQLVEILKNQGVSMEELSLFYKFKKIIEAKLKRDLNKGQDEGNSVDNKDNDLLSELARKFNTRMESAKNLSQGRKAQNDNVYMQHIPDISTMLTDLSKNKLSQVKFGIIGGTQSKEAITPASVVVPQDVIIFVVGGVTYEEARLVRQFNETMKGKMRVILGGTSVISTSDYLSSFS
ncbi:hypothetical protein NCAS_0H01080 [Naumovozyma castellii]|uniref:Uncharacterized protein n=1 Tax=Naumovozyma castellii TaxID=27288 RepID=G0VIU1_NAUCA|nr:hypothetical protein NCAS_0H01080 [Naumovozyma castellii CBS 4309]CCC71418.1 hypothetical protein NCAS_0H01080 [Naumovozyma castellii CBS 4309]